MTSSIFLASHILPLILFHLLLATEPTSSVRVTLTRTNSGKTWFKDIYTYPFKNNPSASPIKSSLKAHNDLYIMSLAIGTPPVLFSAVMDTGSDLIWTKCKTSPGLESLFDPSNSRSFSNADKSCADFGLDQSCIQKYNDGKVVSLSLGQDILTIGTPKFEDITFACGTPNDDKYDGIIGMGRGDLSLVSQLKQRVFSYCLGSRFDPNTNSVFLTGSRASNIQDSDFQTMPLLEQQDKSYYYVSLEGISVGETRLPVTKSDFAIRSNGDGGMIIDSGTTFTYLEQGIVGMISNEFMNQTQLENCNDTMTPYDLEHCFKYQGYDKNQVPKLVFHFEGANWELGRENYIYEQQDGEGGCLAFIARNSDDNFSTFGNMQQQNMMVIYDLDNKSLSFKHAICNEF